MFDVEVVKLVPGVIGGGVFAIVFLFAAYLLRESILAALSRSVQRDIEAKKAAFQKELEHWKSELEGEKERLKHELAKEAMKAQLVTGKIHEVYVELFEKLRKAEGAVGVLTGVRFVPQWDKLSDSEIKKLFNGYIVSEERINKVIAAIDRSDKLNGFRGIREFHYEMELHVAEKNTREAKNFAILNELHLSDNIGKAVFNMCNLLNTVRIDADIGRIERSLISKAMEAAKQLEPQMNELRAQMRRELGSIS